MRTLEGLADDDKVPARPRAVYGDEPAVRHAVVRVAGEWRAAVSVRSVGATVVPPVSGAVGALLVAHGRKGKGEEVGRVSRVRGVSVEVGVVD